MPDSQPQEETEEDTNTMTTYCVPVDEVDPSITDTLNLEIPLNGQYSPNKAVNNLIQMVIYFSSFLIVILVSVVTIPFFYNIFILEVIKDFVNEKNKAPSTKSNTEIAQLKLNSLFGTDVLSFISLVIIIVLCILDGITSNNISSTIISIFLFIFGVISYGRIQLMKMDENKFIKEFTGEDAGTMDSQTNKMSEPSFSNNNITCITNTLMNTLKYIFWEDKFIYAFLYIVLYSLTVTFVSIFSKWSESTISIFCIIMVIIDVYVVSYIKYMAHKYFSNK